MNVTVKDLSTARVWVLENAGDDDPLDLYAWKLLDMQKAQHLKSATYHDRQAAEAAALMEEIEAEWEVSGTPVPDDEDVVF